MEKLNVVILAAGKGERMRSSLPKVMHELIDRPLIDYVYEAAKSLKPQRIVVVVGYGKEKVMGYLKDRDVEFAVQEEQKGTAHALLSARDLIDDGDTLVLYGDVPLIEKSTLESLIQFYRSSRSITFLITEVENPRGYGRVLLNGNLIERIVEEREATCEERMVRLVNSGVCILPRETLDLVKRIKNENAGREYYLTDICKVAKENGREVRGFFHEDSREVLGINTKEELLLASEILRERVICRLLNEGVSLMSRNIIVGTKVRIGSDTKIGANTVILGKTLIGERVTIGSNVIIRDSVIGDGARIGDFSYLESSEVAPGEMIPQFSNFRSEKTCVA